MQTWSPGIKAPVQQYGTGPGIKERRHPALGRESFEVFSAKLSQGAKRRSMQDDMACSCQVVHTHLS